MITTELCKEFQEENEYHRSGMCKGPGWDVLQYGYAGTARKWVCSEQSKKHRVSGGEIRGELVTIMAWSLDFILRGVT